MRTYPSSEDIRGATYYYYPGRWIQFQDRTCSAQFLVPKGAFLAELSIVAFSPRAHTQSYSSDLTGYPFIHLGGEQQCG